MSWLTLDDQSRIDEAVREVKAKTGKSYPTSNLLDIIHTYASDVEVKEYDFGDDSSKIKGAVKYPDGSIPVILINGKRISGAGYNFTLAHEFGHYVLHKGKEKFRLDLFDYAADTKESKQETEANYFAASLLMPKKEFEELLAWTQDNEKIAEYFGVSVPAVEARIKWLNQNKK
jgi:Zn-dependent peptidase ImmA (M78 family)